MISEFAATTRALRHEAGLSQDVVARRIRVSKSYVALMESGRRLPHRDVVLQLDSVLGAGGRLIALADGQRDQRRNVDDVNRRDVLKAVSLGSADVAARQRIGRVDAELLVARTTRLRKLDDTLGGADTYSLFLREVRTTHSMISHCSYSESVGRALLGILSEQAQLAGWAAFDAGWNKEAAKLFSQSHSWAQTAANSALAANALALLAYQRAFNGEPDIRLADASREAMDTGTPQQVRALVLERAAWTYAVARRGADSDRALDQAHEALAHPFAVPGPAWTAWIDEVELQIMTGRCRAALEDRTDAIEPLSRALTTFPDECARDKALYLLALAKAHVASGEVEAATDTVIRAAGLAAGVRSCRPGAHIARLEAVLVQRHGQIAAVSAMRDRLRHLGQLSVVD